ncbi:MULTISPECIES: hypothetical protein [Chryseobacterium]|uniref:Lipoprotein n=1 Tax=Chryseobacterium geocarposphaerae TaxID=1416776 RepID=A0ABU1LG56_9FLAO|nr:MULTISPECIES: hypothetical protein [Chryseobacterium]MDR6405713.1 hypothetical protein [Chryseobacterium geocarposphaerae]MDR6699125.1 hypothetical protein [Chryseobacterium ginsenosidimutans]
MTKKFISWLSLMAVFILLLQSCRNDQFPEQETHNNGSAFRLTSKTISLSESKHFAKLSTELQKAEQTFKTFKANVSGKVVHYGNGVSIDTDQVIYIENGSNYHTYTFKINRENAPTDAPVENLLLTPLPDGTYREFLVTYNFTEQEKQIILSGGDVNRKGKVEVTELEKGTFGNPMGKQTCGYQDVDVYFACYTGDHHAGNESTWGSCNWESAEGGGGYPAKHYTMVAMVCTGDPDPIDDSFYPIGGGGSSGGGGIFPNPDPQPEEPPCVVVPSTSLDPTLTDENGCAIGTPTLPNLGGNPNNPCEKIKNTLNKPEVQNKIQKLKQQAQLPAVNSLGGEKGFKVKTDGTIEDAGWTDKHKVDYGDLSASYVSYHNHTLRGIHMLSHRDLDILLALTKHNSVTGPSNAMHGMIAAEGDGNGGYMYLNYVVRFNGTYQDAIGFNFTDDQLNKIETKYEDVIDKLLADPSNTDNNGSTLNKEGLQKLFFAAAKLMGMQNNVILYRIDEDGVKEIGLNSDGSTTLYPCS